MNGPVPAASVDGALDGEREFVLTLGGFSLEIAGATLVTHEKLPVPAFNYVRVREVAPERRTAFFERALDHYFQRALRPSFRVPEPVPRHLDEGLRRLGFEPRADPLTLLVESGAPVSAPASRATVRPAEKGELDRLLSFWTHERERPELRAALAVAWSHPNPSEALVPLVATLDGELAATAIAYQHRHSVGLHLVGTAPSSRGQGAATALLEYAVRARPTGSSLPVCLLLSDPRPVQRLQRLGLSPAARFVEYRLDPAAALVLPAVAPPGPPRWRPLR